MKKKSFAILLTMALVAVFVMAMTVTTFADDGSILSVFSFESIIKTFSDMLANITKIQAWLTDISSAISTISKALSLIAGLF